MGEPEQMKMNKNVFWELMAQMRVYFGQNQNTSVQWLQNQLVRMSPENIRAFHNIFFAYSELANKFGLWNVGQIMIEGCPGSVFGGFRAWVIAQGRDVYFNALQNPDSMADVTAYGSCTFYAPARAGDSAYRQVTGESLFDTWDAQQFDRLKNELRADITYSPEINIPLEWAEMADHLPRLCAKYFTPRDMRALTAKGPLWNHENPSVRAALRAAGREVRPRGGEAR